MIRNIILTFGLGYSLCLMGCSETTPVNQTKQKKETAVKPISTSYNSAPLVSFDELDEDDYDDYFAIDGESGILFSDSDGDFDSITVKNNQQIKSRAIGSINIEATGVSLLTQRTDYDTVTGEVSGYRLYEYDPVTGIRTQRTRYNSPGIDMIWFNEDDDVRDYATYDALIGTVQTLTVRYNGPGADTIWFTEDDAVQRYETDVLDAAGVVVAKARYNGPGIDTLWFTADDDVQYVTAESTAADGSLLWIQYNDAGADVDWATLEDNAVGHFSTTMLNADSLELQILFYVDPGVDLIPFNEDDTFMYYRNYTYNPTNLMTNSVRYNDPGVDLLWLNGDDTIDVCQEVTYTVDGAEAQDIRSTVGTDNLCFTGDDLFTRYDVRAYDDTAHLTGEQRFEGAGIDEIWFTEDDVLRRESVYTPQ